MYSSKADAVNPSTAYNSNVTGFMEKWRVSEIKHDEFHAQAHFFTFNIFIMKLMKSPISFMMSLEFRAHMKCRTILEARIL